LEHNPGREETLRDHGRWPGSKGRR
jgi:hypothetical protein